MILEAIIQAHYIHHAYDNLCIILEHVVIIIIIGDFKGGPGPPGEKLVMENHDEMLTYALALLNQVFLAHKHVILDLL